MDRLSAPRRATISGFEFRPKAYTMASNGHFIAYYRVSTAKRGRSGLGIEAQQAAVERYLNGGNWNVVETFTEVESGRNSERPALAKALATARVRQVPIVVARRLTGSPARSDFFLCSSTPAWTFALRICLRSRARPAASC
jgi:hypothetical protein